MNMSKLGGFCIEEMIHITTRKHGGETQEPKVELLMDKLRELQQGKNILEEEFKEIKLLNDSLQKELVNLESKALQLEGTHKEKEDLYRMLQFQVEESEKDTVRQMSQNNKSEELLEQYRCEIQKYKLQHRKQRIFVENQFHQLIEQHKNSLQAVFTPEGLPQEIERAENTKIQLLSAEQIKLSQLLKLSENLEEVKKQKQAKVVVNHED